MRVVAVRCSDRYSDGTRSLNPTSSRLHLLVPGWAVCMVACRGDPCANYGDARVRR